MSTLRKSSPPADQPTLIHLSKEVSIPLLDFATQGNAILGIRESGKSYTATWFAERLMDAGIPFLAFDPIGVWRFLKTPGNGPNAKGYPVVVAGQNGDIDLKPESTEAFVLAAMAENVSVVIDLFSMPHLSKAEKRRMVETAVNVLLFKNDRLRHIFIEEAAEYCPQRLRPEYGSVYASIEQLARMGGNRYLGYTLINQRAEEVNKAVLELCDCLFLHRQKGKNSLDSLRNWLDITDVSQSREIISSLPKLASGECWVWMGQSNDPIRLNMPVKRSAHPNRRIPSTLLTAVPAGVAADVAPFVARMKSHLHSLEQTGQKKATPLDRASAAEILTLRATIADLQRELATIRLRPVREVPIVTSDQAASLRKTAEMLSTNATALSDLAATIVGTLEKIQNLPPSSAPAREPRAVTPPSENAGVIGGGVRRMLIALAQRPGLNKRQLGLRAGLSSNSGTFRNYMATLRRNTWLNDNDSEHMSLTPAGVSSLGSFEPLPTGKALQTFWLSQLRSGPGRILKVLTEVYPNSLDKQQLTELSGMTNSGTFRNYLSELRGYELIVGRGDALRASDELFD